jgi:hypothetical protein
MTAAAAAAKKNFFPESGVKPFDKASESFDRKSGHAGQDVLRSGLTGE